MVLLKRSPIQSLSQIAYTSIVGAIIDQRFKPGAPLNIDELARQLDMSNTPVREALTRATSEGLVVKASNKGYSVARLLDRAGYECLFETRILLEDYAVRHIQSLDLENLRSLVDQYARVSPGNSYADFREMIEFDRQFHLHLVDGSGNPFISRAWRDLHSHLHQNRLRLYGNNGEFDHEGAVREHKQILMILADGDNEEAAVAVIQHIENTCQRLLPLLKDL